MDPEDKAMDERACQFFGDWDAPRDKQGQLLDTWFPTHDLDLANRLREYVEGLTGRPLNAPTDDPRAMVRVGLNEIGKLMGHSRT